MSSRAVAAGVRDSASGWIEAAASRGSRERVIHITRERVVVTQFRSGMLADNTVGVRDSRYDRAR
jgi:hypothetical protein